MSSRCLRQLSQVLLVVAALVNRPVWAQDFQLIAVGNGAGPQTTQCVLPGLDGTPQSTPGGDDVVNGSIIETGPNGICETVLAGDDVRPDNGVTFGTGLPNAAIIVSGSVTNPALDNGICDDSIVALGDDVILIPPGHGQPRALEILSGRNGMIDSTPAGDDQLTGVICAGQDGSFETTTLFTDDEQVANGDLCPDLCASSGCIVPGADGLLETAPAGDDVLVPFVSTGANGVAETTAASDDQTAITPGSGAKRAVCVSAGPDGLAQTTICGNGVRDIEENGLLGAECEVALDANCSALCQPEVCGNGIIDPGEECDDGNTRNNDACVLGCRKATCGDGYIEHGVEQCEPPNTAKCNAMCRRILVPGCGNGQLDPGEECDDGNGSSADDCTTSCTVARCGDGWVHNAGTGPFEECDDGNLQSGDGCSSTCTLECGNGVIDGACARGNIGASCSTDAECDITGGDGVCVHEECDPGAAQLCIGTAPVCSNACLFEACGNGVQECAEECDLGYLNGIPGSGCSATCTRLPTTLESRSGECLSEFTVDEAPDLQKVTQICHDGALCDFDQIPGQCTFRIGVCLNRTGVAGCVPGNIRTFELANVNLTHPEEAAAAQALIAAVVGLAPGTATVPDRCRKGSKGKICSIPNNQQCDSALGAGDGVCDIGSGVVFGPALDAATQVAPCTQPVDVMVPVGGKLRLRSRAKVALPAKRPTRDNDALRLSCRPAP